MAAFNPSTDVSSPAPQSVPAAPSVPARMPQAEMAQLAALHREAQETAQLANLLGRAPYAAAMLAVASGFAAALTLTSATPERLIAWLMLMLIALGAIVRAYGQAIRAPFERAPLAAFAQDFTAILTYAGFAWGAGAFLVLPAQTGPAGALAFVMIPAAVVVAALRGRGGALGFLAPAAALSAFAMVLRPLAQGALDAALVLLAAGAIAGAVLWHERRSAKTLPHLPTPLFG